MASPKEFEPLYSLPSQSYQSTNCSAPIEFDTASTDESTDASVFKSVPASTGINFQSEKSEIVVPKSSNINHSYEEALPTEDQPLILQPNFLQDPPGTGKHS